MPRKDQGWITFQASEEERQLLETICQQSQRTKTEVLREMLRGLRDDTTAQPEQPVNVPLPETSEPQPRALPKRPFKVSSRNVLEGRVKHIIKGSVNTEVTLEIVHAVELTSIITTTSAETLELAEGNVAYAVIKSSDVVIAIE
ncbi:MAG: molybdopterin-binding protein [Stenomitos rutilans HA7619-LM2]|jgi:molybdopterin-binding protein|nr:molybdopterin-binding protein [Stenomitos rutilans HA7619-LM2]